MKLSIKKILLFSSLVYLTVFIAGCTSEKQIEMQKQKEIDVIKVQQEKEMAIEQMKEKQRQKQIQVQQDKLNLCFIQADKKRVESAALIDDAYLSKCKNIKSLNLTDAEFINEYNNCLKQYDPAIVQAANEALDKVKQENENDRAECLKIYPQN